MLYELTPGTAAELPPILLLHGDQDGATLPATSAGQQDDFTAHYERRVIPGAGHFLPRETPHALLTAAAALAER